MNSPEPVHTISEYSLLQDGNYWVYERNYLDSSGNYTGATPQINSLIVQGDSIIDGVVWKAMRSRAGGAFSPISFRRDSANYLLQLGHGRLFAASDTDLFLWQEHFTGIIDVNYELHVTDQQIVVPAGSFNCQEVKGRITSIGGPIPPDHRFPRAYWRAGQGMVLSRFYWYGSGNGIESRLISSSVH